VHDGLMIQAKELPTPLYALDNDQALVVDGEKVELIGGGSENIFGK